MANLLEAAKKGNVEIVQKLLEHKADVNQVDNNGYTPLNRASENGHVEVITKLLEHKADINQADKYGYTPLNMASYQSCRAFMPGGDKPGGLYIKSLLVFILVVDSSLVSFWSTSRRLRNRRMHALHGNGDRVRAASRASPAQNKDKNTGGPLLAVARRAALRSELEAAGFQVKLDLAPSALLHLFRRRPDDAARALLLKESGGSHIVGDDALCPSNGRGSVLDTDFWKMHPKFSWGSASANHPVVLFSDHLVRLKNRVAWEFANSPSVDRISVVLQIPRASLESATDYPSFSKAVDTSVIDWGAQVAISGVVGFMAPLSMRRFPDSSRVIPPPAWQSSTLPATFAVVALTLSRAAPAQVVPTFRKAGSYDSLAALRAKDRAGLIRIVLEIDIGQREFKRSSLPAFARRALADLLASLPDSTNLPSLPVQGLRHQGDMVSGFVDLPNARAAQALRASGRIRGVFTRPWVGGGDDFPFPSGFSATSHRIIWCKVKRFSDLICSALDASTVAFDGLVCPRHSGEIGVRVAQGTNPQQLEKCLTEGFDARVKLPVPGRATLRASNVPVATLEKLHLLVTRVDADLRLLSSRVLRTSAYSAVVDLDVSGASLSEDSWVFSDLGLRPVIVRKLPPRRPLAVAQRLSARDPVPSPRRPLSKDEKTTWASVARGIHMEAASDSVAPAAASPPPASSGSPGLASLPLAPPASVAIPDEHAEIPIPAVSKTGKNKKRSLAADASALLMAPKPGGKSGSPPITTFFKQSSQTTSPAASPMSSGSGSNSSPAAAPLVVVSPATSSSGSPDVDAFKALEAKVNSLIKQLEDQQAYNRKLETALQQAQQDCGDLRNQLRTLRVRRTRSAERPAGDGGLDSDASMDSAEAQPATRRKSPGRESPTH